MIEFIKFSDQKPCFNDNFSGIQLIPLNYDSYVIPFIATMTETVVFSLIDCFGNETNISENCKIAGQTIEISKLTYDTDRRVFLKIKGDKTYYSNIFKVSSEKKEYTTRIDYRCKKDDTLYSIQLQIFEVFSKRATELNPYYKMSTHNQVSYLSSNAKYFVFKTKLMFIETLNSIVDVFNNREVYFDYEQVNLFSAPDIDDPEPYTYILETNFEITKLGNRIEPKMFLITNEEVTRYVCIGTCRQSFNSDILGKKVKLTIDKEYLYRENSDNITFIFDDNMNVVTKEQIDLLPIGVLQELCTYRNGNERIITDKFESILINK